MYLVKERRSKESYCITQKRISKLNEFRINKDNITKNEVVVVFYIKDVFIFYLNYNNIFIYKS